MDTIAKLLTEYTVGLKFDDLPEEVIHETKRRCIDTSGCAMGGLSASPSSIVRELACNITSSGLQATVMGCSARSSVETAAFANGVAARYLDYNDTYLSLTPSHPSDVILPIIAAAEAAGADGRAVITAVNLAYEVLCRFYDVSDMWARGWDYSSLGALSTALAVAKLLNLSQGQVTNAIALALCSNVVLRQTRVGAITDWKVCAFPNACRNGILAALLAQKGMTGPLEPFQGKGAFCSQVSGSLTLTPFGGNGNRFKLLDTSLKFFPACYLTQTAIEAALEVRKEIGNVEEVEHITIQAGFRAIDDTADTPDKWHPNNLFTANNSLPYTVAVALIDGVVDTASFSSQRLNDERLRQLVERVQVKENPQFSQAPLDANPVLVEVATSSGASYSKQITYAKGHPRNPASDEEVEAKFRSLVHGRFSEAKVKSILERMWHLEQEECFTEMLELFQLNNGPFRETDGSYPR